MIQARATVLRVENGEVWLRVEDRQGGCGRCDEPGGCRSTRLAEIFKRSGDLVRLPDSLGLNAGDGVTISVPEGALLRAAVLAYVLPLGLMLVLAALALLVKPFASDDANVLAGVALGLVLGIWAGRRTARQGRWRSLELTLAPVGRALPGCGDRP